MNIFKNKSHNNVAYMEFTLENFNIINIQALLDPQNAISKRENGQNRKFQNKYIEFFSVTMYSMRIDQLGLLGFGGSKIKEKPVRGLLYLLG